MLKDALNYHHGAVFGAAIGALLGVLRVIRCWRGRRSKLAGSTVRKAETLAIFLLGLVVNDVLLLIPSRFAADSD